MADDSKKYSSPSRTINVLKRQAFYAVPPLNLKKDAFITISQKDAEDKR